MNETDPGLDAGSKKAPELTIRVAPNTSTSAFVPRLATTEEAAVIAAISITIRESRHVKDERFETLQVLSNCTCGCPSLTIRTHADSADAWMETLEAACSEGHYIGIHVFGAANEIEGIDMQHVPSDFEDGLLPLPESIKRVAAT